MTKDVDVTAGDAGGDLPPDGQETTPEGPDGGQPAGDEIVPLSTETGAAKGDTGEEGVALDEGADTDAGDDDNDPGSRPRDTIGEDPDSAPSSSSPRKVPWRRLGGAGAGVIAVALTAGAALLLPGAVPSQHAPVDLTQSVAVAPAAERWVCPGPARLTDTKAVGDDQFDSSPVETESVLTAMTRPLDATATFSDLGGKNSRPLADGDDAATATQRGIAEGMVLTVTPDADSGAVEAVAGSSSLTTAGDLRGLVAASCVHPGVGAWLVGGSTEVGSSAQLVLQNPGDTPATVRINVWGSEGSVALGSGTMQVVAPGTETITILEAAAPEQSRVVVQVTATGSMIGAYLQHNTLDGLIPVGVDNIVPGAEPATRLAVSGVITSGVSVDDPYAPRLRLLAPDTATTARMVVLGPDGPVRLRGAEEVALQPGVVTDVSLGGLPEGTYGVAIEADAPVVSGAMMTRQGDPDPNLLNSANQYDRAWIAAQPAAELPSLTATELGGVALVPEATSTLMIAAVPAGPIDPENGTKPTGELAGTLTSFDTAGNLLGTLDVQVKAGSMTTVDAASIAPKESAAPAFVTLTMSDGTAGVVPVWSVLAAAGPVSASTPSLVSVLLPVDAVSSGSTAVVRVGDTLGLPDEAPVHSP